MQRLFHWSLRTANIWNSTSIILQVIQRLLYAFALLLALKNEDQIAAKFYIPLGVFKSSMHAIDGVSIISANLIKVDQRRLFCFTSTYTIDYTYACEIVN